MSIGQRIRSIRQERGMSLRELARRMDISAAHLSDIELGRRTATSERLGQIARIFEVSREYLLGPVEER